MSSTVQRVNLQYRDQLANEYKNVACQGAEAWLDKNASNAEEVRITENKWTKHSTLEAEKIEWTQKGRRKEIKKIMISNL